MAVTAMLPIGHATCTNEALDGRAAGRCCEPNLNLITGDLNLAGKARSIPMSLACKVTCSFFFLSLSPHQQADHEQNAGILVSACASCWSVWLTDAAQIPSTCVPRMLWSRRDAYIHSL